MSVQVPLGSSPTQLVEYAGGEEQEPLQESSIQHQHTTNEILEPSISLTSHTSVSAIGAQGNIVDVAPTFSAPEVIDDHAAHVGLRRFSHPTPHVDPLIQESISQTNKEPSRKSSMGREQIVGDAGRPLIFDMSNSVANLLEFFRSKILELENRMISLAAQREEDAKLQTTIAAKVDRMFHILDAASHDLLSPEKSDLTQKSITSESVPQASGAVRPTETASTRTEMSSGYESDEETGAIAPPSTPTVSPAQPRHVLPWDPEVWTPLLRSGSAPALEEEGTSSNGDIFEEVEKLQAGLIYGTRGQTPIEPEPEPEKPTFDLPPHPLPRSFDARRRYSVSAESISVDQAASLRAGSLIPKPGHVRVRLRELLMRESIFRHVDQRNLDDLIDTMKDRRVEPGEFTVRQGDLGDEMYVIEDGKFTVLYGEREVAVLDAGKIFGEISLMYNCPRTASVRADKPGTVWVVDRPTFRSILMQDSIQKRAKYEGFLAKVSLFSTLYPYERAKIADALESASFATGEMIIEQGNTEDDRFFVIEDGQVEFWKRDDANTESEAVFCGKAGPGDYFGELSLLTARPRQASVIAKTPVVCLTMKREDFTRVMGPCEEILRRNMNLYKNYQDLMHHEKDRLARTKMPVTDSELSEAAPVLSMSDFLQSVATSQCIIQDLLLATVQEAQEVFSLSSMQLVGDKHQILTRVNNILSTLNDQLSLTVSRMDEELRNLSNDDESRACNAIELVGKLADTFPIYEQLAGLYFALRTEADIGRISVAAMTDTVPLAQQQLDYIDSLLSHPSNLTSMLEELLPSIAQVGSTEAVDRLVNLINQTSAAYKQFSESKIVYSQVYEALRDHPGLVEETDIVPDRKLFASASALLLGDSENIRIQVFVFNDFVGFIKAENGDQKQTKAFPLVRASLVWNEANNRVDLFSPSIGLIASFDASEGSPEWLLKLRDAIELANSMLPPISSSLPLQS